MRRTGRMLRRDAGRNGTGTSAERHAQGTISPKPQIRKLASISPALRAKKGGKISQPAGTMTTKRWMRSRNPYSSSPAVRPPSYRQLDLPACALASHSCRSDLGLDALSLTRVSGVPTTANGVPTRL